MKLAFSAWNTAQIWNIMVKIAWKHFLINCSKALHGGSHSLGAEGEDFYCCGCWFSFLFQGKRELGVGSSSGRFKKIQCIKKMSFDFCPIKMSLWPTMNNFLAAALCGGLQLMQSMQLFGLITSVVMRFKAYSMFISLEFQFCILRCAWRTHLRTLWHNTAK